jgi:hypothetical protein
MASNAVHERDGSHPHTFTDAEQAKAVESRRRKAAERRESAMCFPQYAREGWKMTATIIDTY